MTDRKALLERQLERQRAARREAERLLEAKADELYETLTLVQASENLLNTALNSMTDGLLLTQADHEVVLVNRQFGIIYPDQADALQPGCSLTEAFEELATQPEYLSIVEGLTGKEIFEFTRADGRTISVGVRVTAEGLVASTHRDVTDAKEQEQERQGLVVELMAAQRMEALGRMAGMIAHDFNNVVASIRGYAGFLQEDLEDDDQRQESVRRILGASDRAAGLIDQLLARQARREAPRQSVSLVPVLDDCCDMAMAEDHGALRLAFDPPESPIWISSDENLLSRLFTNLLTNALQSLPREAGKISVDIDLCDDYDAEHTDPVPAFGKQERVNRNWMGQQTIATPCARVTITDNGSGIEPDVMDQIFDMYYSTRSSEHNAGVGMASVADVVTDMGGCVRVASQPGTGTMIEVVLPLDPERVPSARENGPSEAPADLAPGDVLVVDDEKDVGHVIAEMLERDGLSVTLTASPEAALAALLDDPTRWRLVVCDHIMPRLRGGELLRRLRVAGVTIPLILCSARVDPTDGDLAKQLGDRFIRKPIDRQRLIDTVRKNLPSAGQ